MNTGKYISEFRNDLQAEIDFTIPHNQHRGNQEILSSNRPKFSGQAKIVLEALLRGEEVTSVKMLQHGILDTRARIYSLKKHLEKHGILISEKPVGGGQKAWFMDEQQIQKYKHI